MTSHKNNFMKSFAKKQLYFFIKTRKRSRWSEQFHQEKYHKFLEKKDREKIYVQNWRVFFFN